MNVLVACEFSGVVRDAFSDRGHMAVSCDLRPSETNGWHYEGDVRDILDDDWDLVIGFPPCTDTSWSNGKLIHEKRADGRTQSAVQFAKLISNTGKASAIEHPYRSDLFYWRRPDQAIHPWQFGDPYIKWTGLWLRGLPHLQPTVEEEPEEVRYWISVGAGKQGRRGGKGVKRNSLERARTFPGIARAMAEAWG